MTALLAAYPFSAGAEGPSSGPSVYTLDKMVVTATKTERAQNTVTQKIDVIDSSEIEKMVFGKGNLAEAVSHLPGAYVNVLAKNQPNWGSVGGLGTNYNTYMLDGLPVDAFCDPMSIDPWIVERIEVQRGPASVLYPNFLSQDFSGNQSPLAGTTNLILKERVAKPGTRVLAGYGSFHTSKARVEHRNHMGNFHFHVGGGMEKSDYTNYRYKPNNKPSGLDMTEDPDYFNKTVDLRSTYFFNNADDHKLSFYLHHMWHDGDMGRPNRELDHNTLTAQTKYTAPVGDWGSARVQLGYLSYDRNFGEDMYPASLNARGVSGVDQKIIPGDLSISADHFDIGRLTLGTDFQLADYQWFNGTSSSDRINDATANQLGVYLQEELLLDKWLVRAGARFSHTEHDYDLMGGQKPEKSEMSWDSVIWSAGARYNATDRFSLYANAGTSYLVPAAKFIGGTIRASDEGKAGFSGMLPNPDLKEEKGLGLDAGFDFHPNTKTKTGIRMFYNKVDDAVVRNTVHASINQTRAVNAGEAVSYGCEISFNQEVNKQFHWFANYTYTHSRIENEVNPDMDDVEMSGYPEHMGNIGAFFILPYDISLSTWLKLVGPVWNSTSKKSRIKLDSYELLGIKVEKGIKINNTLCNLFLELNNTTDNRYKTIYYYQDPGFTALAGIQVSF